MVEAGSVKHCFIMQAVDFTQVHDLAPVWSTVDENVFVRCVAVHKHTLYIVNVGSAKKNISSQ